MAESYSKPSQKKPRRLGCGEGGFRYLMDIDLPNSEVLLVKIEVFKNKKEALPPPFYSRTIFYRVKRPGTSSELGG
jgi:hypothetical protein